MDEEIEASLIYVNARFDDPGLKRSLKVLDTNKMACVRCPLIFDCPYCLDPYNFGVEAGVDCLAAK